MAKNVLDNNDWDDEIEHPTYNPFLTLREKPVIINPRVYGKRSKKEKNDFKMEERSRWKNIIKDQKQKEEEWNALLVKHQMEIKELRERHEREIMDLEKQQESWDGEYYISPLYYIKKQKEAREKSKTITDDCLSDCSWDNDNYVSPLNFIRRGVNNLKL